MLELSNLHLANIFVRSLRTKSMAKASALYHSANYLRVSPTEKKYQKFTCSITK